MCFRLSENAFGDDVSSTINRLRKKNWRAHVSLKAHRKNDL